MTQSMQIRQLLADHSMPAASELVHVEDDRSVHCVACGHRCHIQPGSSGVCRVRFNDGGELRVPAGYVAGLQVDPIEKKPFYHAYPGCEALSFGMLGCDFHCSFCQNWVSSQALRDERAVAVPTFCSADRIADLAAEQQTPVMVSTYNEPLITADWAVEVFKLARAQGVICGLVSNGYATPEVLAFLRPYVDLLNIDLKAFTEDHYRQLGGHLQIVLDAIRQAHDLGFWVEVVSLIVPGLNDSDDELRRMADFVAGVSPDIPWHVTAFHPAYKTSGPGRTPGETLLRAADHGRAAGLPFVYVGNLPGLAADRENTNCPSCGAVLIERRGFAVRTNRMAGSSCPDCGAMIPGVWQDAAPRAGGPGRPRPLI